MNTLQKTAALLAAAAAFAVLPAHAYAESGETRDFDAFVKMCDANNDGMVSKKEAMAAIEKMFDRHDAKKTGMLDRKQFEIFLRELMKTGG